MILVHILRDGVVLVPAFPAPKISKLMQAHSVRPTDYFWHEGMSAWQLVSTRWEPDAGSSPAPASVVPAPATSTTATRTTDAHATQVVSRRDRVSLLFHSRKRYHETLVPWAQDAATPQAI